MRIVFSKYILWTCESAFSTRKDCKKQITRYWSVDNGRQLHQNVWCGDWWCKQLYFVPIFIDQNITGDHYLHRYNSIYMEVLPPQHISANNVSETQRLLTMLCNFFNMEYSRGWIGIGGTICWSANSPELTLMNIFFGGCI